MDGLFHGRMEQTLLRRHCTNIVVPPNEALEATGHTPFVAHYTSFPCGPLLSLAVRRLKSRQLPKLNRVMMLAADDRNHIGTAVHDEGKHLQNVSAQHTHVESFVAQAA